MSIEFLPNWAPAAPQLGAKEALILAGSHAVGEEDCSGEFGDLDLYYLGPGLRLDAVREWSRLDARIHVVHMTAEQAGAAPKTYRAYEAGEVGRVVAGSWPDRPFPAFHPRQLDFGDLNDILVWRAVSVLRASQRSDSRREVSYRAAKSRLDLGIWLAGQYELLVASHRLRIAALQQLEPGGRDRLTALLAEWLKSSDECLRVKTEGRSFRDPTTELDRTLNMLMSAADLVITARVPHPETSDRKIRRRASVNRELLRRFREVPPSTVRALIWSPHHHLLTMLARGDAKRMPDRFARSHSIVFKGQQE